MQTVEVTNSYNVRRQQLVAELEYAEKEVRGLLTRSVLNTDLAATTYEVLINSLVKIREFDRFKIQDIEKRYYESRRWIIDYSESVNRVISYIKRKKLTESAQNIENLLNQRLDHIQFLEKFYINYFEINLGVLEDPLIQIFISEDNTVMFNEITSMLNDLTELHPIGGLTSMIKIILQTCNKRQVSYDNKDKYINYIELYCDSSFIWSQAAQLFIEFIETLENGGQVILEDSNARLQKRMSMIVKRYGG